MLPTTLTPCFTSNACIWYSASSATHSLLTFPASRCNCFLWPSGNTVEVSVQEFLLYYCLKRFTFQIRLTTIFFQRNYNPFQDICMRISPILILNILNCGDREVKSTACKCSMPLLVIRLNPWKYNNPDSFWLCLWSCRHMRWISCCFLEEVSVWSCSSFDYSTCFRPTRLFTILSLQINYHWPPNPMHLTLDVSYLLFLAPLVFFFPVLDFFLLDLRFFAQACPLFSNFSPFIFVLCSTFNCVINSSYCFSITFVTCSSPISAIWSWLCPCLICHCS